MDLKMELPKLRQILCEICVYYLIMNERPGRFSFIRKLYFLQMQNFILIGTLKKFEFSNAIHRTP
ncbi:hypothetical protein B1J94_05015 [Leptospira kirschneri serovar Grippotyphosa]|nr:hypothetical protein B1J94_05015 [Leptospira kirschneri serovar Grippotyphosa]